MPSWYLLLQLLLLRYLLRLLLRDLRPLRCHNFYHDVVSPVSSGWSALKDYK
ncbi:hypothetical protein MGN70_010722 [Eutypa lata]|nr:hypothetical protein MGN70_010722 [Eutypa lata]